MGYESYVSGGIRIEPPLPQSIIDSLALGETQDPFASANDLVARRMGEEDTVGVVNGTIGVIPGKAYTWVECRIDERYKAYDLGENLGNLAAAIKGKGFACTGALYIDGEDSDDFSRYRIDEHGDARHESPEWVWPNGDRGWG